MRVAVVEPDAHGRSSGGYLYNRRLAEHDGCELVRVAPGAAPRLSGLALTEYDVILADSLFLEPRGLAPFLELRGRCPRVGVLLHAFPSIIRCASDRSALARSLPLLPEASELELISRLDVVVTPGAYVARLLSQSGSRTPCVVCPPGSEVRPAAIRSSVGSTVRLLVIANLTPAKGVADVLEALSILGEHSWRLTIVGALDAHPSHAAALRDAVSRHDLAPRVRFVGALSHADTLAELDAADVLLSASYTENAPLSVLEALRAGVPVVGYAAGGLSDLVEDGVSGLLVPLLDVPALTGALRRVLVRPDERARLAAGAALCGARLPTWAAAAAAFQRALAAYEW
jgi:glycosyltransferase involved in cell wall biosynthesis